MRYTLPTVLMTCALLFLLSQFGLATDFYIGTQSDLPDTNLGDGLCRTATGTCSLRAAIMQANFHSDIDNIYDNHGWTINVASPLEVSSTIRFYGAGSDGTKTNIDGGDAVEVLRIVPGPTSVYVSDLIMEDVRIRNGRRNIAAGPDVRVELRGCVIIGGQADLGGGIRAHDSTVIVENSRIENNTAPGGGGGIYFDSEDSTKYLYLYETDVEDNTTTGDGGGIHAVATQRRQPHELSNRRQPGAPRQRWRRIRAARRGPDDWLDPDRQPGKNGRRRVLHDRPGTNCHLLDLGQYRRPWAAAAST